MGASKGMGGLASPGAAYYNPAALSGSDKLMMLGAMLKDIGNPDGQSTVAPMQQMLMNRALLMAQMKGRQGIASIFAPGSPPTAAPTPEPSVIGPGVEGQPTGSPAAPSAGSVAAGLPGSSYRDRIAQLGQYVGIPGMESTVEAALKLAEAGQPHYVAGPNGSFIDDKTGALGPRIPNWQYQNKQRVDPGSADAPAYIPDSPAAGANPLMRGNQILDWSMPQGATNAVAASEAAKAAGTALGGLPYAQARAAAEAAGAGAGAAPFKLTTQDVGGVPTTMTEAQAIGLANGGVAPGSPGQPQGPLAPQAFFKSFVAPHEGGFNAHDLNGAAVNMGFNQKSNPDIDVSKLTPDQAAQRFQDKYWVPSGAANLPPALAAVHADTYFINPKAAQRILAQSGGDPNKYMDLREQWLGQIVASNPAAQPYAKAWAQRDADLRAFAGQYAGTSGPAAQPGAPAANSAPGIRGLNKADEAKVGAYMEDARTAEDVVQKSHQFQQLNTKQATGPGYKPFNVPVPFMHQPIDINVPGALARQYQTGVPAMNNLSMQLATGLRAPAQRLTQQEIMMNLKSVPGLTNTPAQNDQLVSNLEERASTKRAYANFMSNWLAKNGSLQGSDAAWGAQQSLGGAAPHQSAAAGPASAIPMLSPAEAAKLPRGAHFRTTDGRVLVRQ